MINTTYKLPTGDILTQSNEPMPDIPESQSSNGNADNSAENNSNNASTTAKIFTTRSPEKQGKSFDKLDITNRNPNLMNHIKSTIYKHQNDSVTLN